VETFVINWAGDLYGDVVRVRFLHRLRDERKFASIEELKAQIEKDVNSAERYFEKAGSRHMLALV
jgi:riboflavin kinase/FMN adenylyltransferase